MKTIDQTLRFAQNQLAKHNIKTAPLDSEVLLAYVLKKPRAFLLTHPEHSLTKKELDAYQKLIKKRAAQCPVAYLTGSKEFFGRDFLVTSDTLVPRPETELLVEKVLGKIHLETKRTNHEREFDIAEIGTGSGCIILSLLGELENSSHCKLPSSIGYYATDISLEALKVAQKNHQVLFGDSNKYPPINFARGNLLEPLRHQLFTAPIKSNRNQTNKNKILFLLANLPYLSQQEYQAAPATVTQYEPKTALFSSQEGLAHYQKLFLQLQGHLSSPSPPTPLSSNPSCSFHPYSKIYIFLELSPSQKQKLERLARVSFSKLPHHSLQEINFHQDLAQKWRLVEITIVAQNSTTNLFNN
jgi:release factor glutamine methyltransferase